MKREGKIDHECIKLAEYFLDGLNIDHPDNVLRVATRIQDAIESEIELD